MSAWALIPAAVGVASLGITAFNKPDKKDYMPNTEYMDRYISSLRGRKASSETYNLAMRPALRNIGSQVAQTRRNTQYTQARAGMQGSGMASAQNLQSQRQALGEIGSASDKAMALQAQENRAIDERVDSTIMQREQQQADAQLRYEQAKSAHKQQLLQQGVSLAGTAASGIGKMVEKAKTIKQSHSALKDIGSDIGIDEYKVMVKEKGLPGAQNAVKLGVKYGGQFDKFLGSGVIEDKTALTEEREKLKKIEYDATEKASKQRYRESLLSEDKTQKIIDKDEERLADKLNRDSDKFIEKSYNINSKMSDEEYKAKLASEKAILDRKKYDKKLSPADADRLKEINTMATKGIPKREKYHENFGEYKDLFRTEGNPEWGGKFTDEDMTSLEQIETWNEEGLPDMTAKGKLTSYEAYKKVETGTGKYKGLDKDQTARLGTINERLSGDNVYTRKEFIQQSFADPTFADRFVEAEERESSITFLTEQFGEEKRERVVELADKKLDHAQIKAVIETEIKRDQKEITEEQSELMVAALVDPGFNGDIAWLMGHEKYKKIKPENLIEISKASKGGGLSAKEQNTQIQAARDAIGGYKEEQEDMLGDESNYALDEDGNLTEFFTPFALSKFNQLKTMINYSNKWLYNPTGFYHAGINKLINTDLKAQADEKAAEDVRIAAEKVKANKEHNTAVGGLLEGIELPEEMKTKLRDTAQDMKEKGKSLPEIIEWLKMKAGKEKELINVVEGKYEETSKKTYRKYGGNPGRWW